MDGLVLAAGLSRRMGRDKLFLPFGSGSVLSTVLDLFRGIPFDRVVVVTSPDRAPAVAALAPDATIVVNGHPERGQSRSLALAVEALGEEPRPFALLLGDMPLVRRSDLERLREGFARRPRGKTALVPERRGRFGHPSFYEPLWKARFREVEGDEGGRGRLRLFAEEVLFLPEDDRLFMDADTPRDYLELLERQQKEEEER